jgi:ArsR family transcriptional regulator
LYRVLSEPVRLRLLALTAEEELSIGELAEIVDESQPNVSRHVAPLRTAGLVGFRKQGTRTLVRLRDEARKDPVVADALASGRGLCLADGSLARVAEVVRARDAAAREYFAKPRKDADVARPPSEIGAYLAALSMLLPRRALAIDAGTGDGGLLDVLAPSFERVIALDRSEAQLARARERVALRGYDNVELIAGELGSAEVEAAVLAHGGADALFAVRLLHHAPRPQGLLEVLAKLTAPGGAALVVDYAPHDDESMRAQADVWLGFDAKELSKMARDAGFDSAQVAPIGAQFIGPSGQSPDAHLPWQVLVAKRKQANQK